MPISSNTTEKNESRYKVDGARPPETAAMLSSEFQNFLADVEELVKATDLLTGGELTKAKTELNNKINAAKTSVASMSNRISEQAKRTADFTNTQVHRQPWSAIGVGSITGFLVGYFLMRSSRK